MIGTGTVPEGSLVVNVGRVLAPNGVVFVSGGAGDAAVTNIDLRVYDLGPGGSPEVAVFSSLAIATGTILKALLTVDGYWDQDTTGYNFLDLRAAASFEQNGGHRYRYEYTLNTGNFGAVAADFIVTIDPRYSS